MKIDWAAFGLTSSRAMDLLRDGKPRSVQDVCEALNSIDCSTRRALVRLCKAGAIQEEFQRRGRHIVVCYKLPKRSKRMARTRVSAVR